MQPAKREVVYRQVQVVYHKQGLEELIHRILFFEGRHYYIRHYDPSPVSIPMLHIVGFDDEIFFLGVGYPRGEPSDNKVLRIRDAKMTPILKDYWRVLWDDGIKLNEGGIIQWDELRRIGDRLGVSDTEFNEMLDDIADKVRKDKRKLKIR